MAYNAATRLLLKFNESNGAVATVDSSQAARAVTVSGSAEVSSAAGVFSTNSLLTGDPFGTESIGGVTVDSPGSIFTNSGTPARRFDFWFRQEASPDAFYGTLFKVTWDDGTSLDVIAGPTGALYVESGPSPELTAGGGLYSGSFYPAYGQWHHARLYIENNHWALGINGSQVDAATGTLSFWPGTASNTVTEFVVGDYGAVLSTLPFRGYIDAFEVTEGDTSWTGGSYTVPTAEPDSYAGGPADLYAAGANTVAVTSSATATLQPVRLAQGANTVAYVGSSTTAVVTPSLVATGANTVVNVSGSGAAIVQDVRLAQGANTVVNVTGSGTAYGPDWFTTLMLHFNLGSQITDWSPHHNTVGLGGVGGSYTEYFTPKFGNAAWAVTGPTGSAGLCLNVPVQSGLFWDKTSDKLVDFWFKTSTPNGTADTLFSIAFAGTTSGLPNAITLYVSPSSALGIEIVTPGLVDIVEIAGGANTGATWRHARLAILGTELYVALDGVVVHSTTAGAEIWPQSDAQTGFSIGNRYPAVADGGFNGYIDEFRIQEGSVGNHGYSGGNFTPLAYEWYPNMRLAQGANTVSVSSSATAILLVPRVATGANTLENVTSTAVALRHLTAQGANTLDNVTQIFGYFQEDLVVVGGNTLAGVTGSGEAVSSWAARGANQVVSVVSQTTADHSIPVFSLVGGNTVSVTSITSATTAMQAAGSNTVSATSAGTMAAFTAAAGLNTVSVTSQGTAVRERYAQGANTVGVTSIGSATVTLFAQGGASLADVFSYGTAKALITCSGSNTVADVQSPRYDSTYESAAAYIRTARSAVGIRTRQQSISVVR